MPGELLAAVMNEQQRIIDVESTVLIDTAQRSERRDHAEAAIAWARSDRDLVWHHMDEFRDALTVTN